MRRKNGLTDIYKAARLCLTLALFCAVRAVYSQDARLSLINEIELMAQPRGIMLIINGSGPIAVGGRTDELEKLTSKYSEVRVSIKNARSALGASSFSVPPTLPVKEISLKESSGGVDLTIKMRSVMNGPVQVRGSGNQIRILLTKDEYPQINWAASTGGLTAGTPAAPAVKSQPKEPVQTQAAAAAQSKTAASVSAVPVKNVIDVSIPSNEPRSLENIRVLQRDRTVSLNFDFSGEPVVSVNKAGDSLIINFLNTETKLSSRLYSVPGNTAYSSIRIRRERAADKSNIVTAIVKLNQKSAKVSPVGVSFDNRYSLYAEGADSARVFLWSAVQGVQSNVSFAQIETAPIDMQKMESRAAKENLKSGGAFFPLNDGGGQNVSLVKSGAVSAHLPVQSVQITPPKPEVPQTAFDDSTSEVMREPADGDLVRYRVYGRDPFIPLMRDAGFTGLPKVENLRLVGVLEDSRERIALLEDFTNENRAFAMRADDKVEYGKVLHIYRDRVVFQMSDFGVARAYTLRLAKDAR